MATKSSGFELIRADSMNYSDEQLRWTTQMNNSDEQLRWTTISAEPELTSADRENKRWKNVDLLN